MFYPLSSFCFMVTVAASLVVAMEESENSAISQVRENPGSELSRELEEIIQQCRTTASCLRLFSGEDTIINDNARFNEMPHNASSSITNYASQAELFQAVNPLGQGDVERARRAIEHGASVNVRDSNTQRTPLQKAVQTGNIELVKFLLEQGSDVHAFERENPSFTHGFPMSVNSLYYALFPCYQSRTHQHFAIAQMLLDRGLNIHILAPDGSPLFYKALQMGDQSLVEWFLEQGVLLDYAYDGVHTPVEYACLCNQWDLARFLIEKYPCSVDGRMEAKESQEEREEYYTPLYYATDAQNHEFVCWVLARGATIDREVTQLPITVPLLKVFVEYGIPLENMLEIAFFGVLDYEALGLYDERDVAESALWLLIHGARVAHQELVCFMNAKDDIRKGKKIKDRLPDYVWLIIQGHPDDALAQIKKVLEEAKPLNETLLAFLGNAATAASARGYLPLVQDMLDNLQEFLTESLLKDMFIGAVLGNCSNSIEFIVKSLPMQVPMVSNCLAQALAIAAAQRKVELVISILALIKEYNLIVPLEPISAFIEALSHKEERYLSALLSREDKSEFSEGREYMVQAYRTAKTHLATIHDLLRESGSK